MYEDMGDHLANSLYEYLLILEEEEKIKLEKKNERLAKKRKDKSVNPINSSA